MFCYKSQKCLLRRQLREETPALDADPSCPYSETLRVLPGLLIQGILDL
jgi:hypothetical protein